MSQARSSKMCRRKERMEEGKSHESPWSLSDMNFVVVKPNTFLKSSYLLSHFIDKVQVG